MLHVKTAALVDLVDGSRITAPPEICILELGDDMKARILELSDQDGLQKLLGCTPY